MKSNVSDYFEVVQAVYIDACAKCIADVSDSRDLDYIRSRIEHEGMSFLTITLPSFARDFERSLANGSVDSNLFRNFRKRLAIPAFLQGMLSQVFDMETGRILNEQSTNSGVSSDICTLVESVRQICLTFKRVKIECTPKRVQSALDSFISIEQSFETFLLPDESHQDFLDVTFLLWSDLVRPFRIDQIIPKHGPGSTADGVRGNSKYRWQQWHDRLEPYFPLIDSAFPLGMPMDAEELINVTILCPDKEIPVKVTPVPKTLKGPRVIALEPCCVQYAQQGIMRWLVKRLKDHPISSGHVNFDDQTINQALALTSSSSGQLATIDLSDASDRVPRDLALEMFRFNPVLQEAIEACRSTKAEMPDGRIIGPLNKFASMGSALCFPVEAMYFYTICVIALLKSQNLPVTSVNVFNVTRLVHVFGDDIIVPSANANVVLDYLQKYNCKVNTNKTFLTGKFRESCGVDAYDGQLVSPTYLGTLCPENKRQASQIISWVATANLFYKRGYWRTAQLLFDKVERIVGSLPYVSENSEGLGRISFLGYRTIERWNESYQRFEVKTLVPQEVYRTDRLSGYGALQKSLASLRDQVDPWASRDASHLEHFALRDAVVLKRRWVPSTI